MKIAKLTLFNGQAVFINPRYLLAIETGTGGNPNPEATTVVRLQSNDGSYFRVKETPEQVVNIIETASQ